MGTSPGNGQDYRPLLLCLRAMQEYKHTSLPPWPRQARDGDGCDARGLMLALMPPSVLSVLPVERRGSIRSMTSTCSAIDSIGSFAKLAEDEEDVRSPTVNSHLAWRGGSSAMTNVHTYNEDMAPRVPTLNSHLAWRGGSYTERATTINSLSNLAWRGNSPGN